ncbi:hypothetical protein I5V28_01430 [Stenotrophomonas maltophilia]|uniref:hypothetical protein n=1 Tax=Stenotrophomonas maltophilia group sp. Smal32 TaxID=3377164 RepID=UPI0018D491BA|nr:hypothetical protein [Stenotrophomonas maltophilia]MBH1744494.1 hypothetical protein [Stenotrophomonas maltophilia]
MAGDPAAENAANVKSGTPTSGGGAFYGFGRWLVGVVRPWRVFLKVVLDPYTFLLIVVGVVLGWFGPKAVGENYNALLQIVVAVVTGVVGARISTAMAAINQDGKLYASGRMAVRGLRLILTKTLALERRVATFVADSQKQQVPEVRAQVAMRNLDEVLESIRTLQLEVVGSIENWVDVVPDADVSKIFMAVGELRDQLTQKDEQLREAVESKERLESKGETDTQALKHAENRIRELERDKAGLANQMHSLKQAATQGSQSTSVMNMLTLGDYLNRVENSRKVRNQRSEITDLSQAILPMNETGEKAGLHEELGRPIPK